MSRMCSITLEWAAKLIASMMLLAMATFLLPLVFLERLFEKPPIPTGKR